MLSTTHLLPQYHIYDCVNHSYRRSQFRNSHAKGATNSKREALSYSIQSTMEDRNLSCAFGSMLVHTKHVIVTVPFTLQEYLASRALNCDRWNIGEVRHICRSLFLITVSEYIAVVCSRIYACHEVFSDAVSSITSSPFKTQVTPIPRWAKRLRI